MFWTVEKLQERIASFDEYRYRDIRRLQQLRFTDDPEAAIGGRPPAGALDGNAGSDQIVQHGSVWGGRDRYVWVSAEASIPAEWKGLRVLGRFDFGSTGGGNNSGFESLLYVDGKPYQGVDTNHQEVFLPDAEPGGTVRLDFRLWSGLGGYEQHRILEHRINRAELCWLHEAADDLYYTAWSVLETVKVLPEDSADQAELLSLLNKAFLLLDWSRPGSERFYESVEQAGAVLSGGLAAMKREKPVEVRCIGHTHIDVAWLWRLRHTREKTARSFSTVLRLMELYPDYVFLQTQPQLYDYLKRDYPEIYEDIKRRAAEGRWEAGGAMWLEADCNLVSGESLVRQILYGTRFFREEFGVDCQYLWLPDVFGYSWALPQILRKSGITMFMTTKISWNQYNRMPHDTFLWRGIDGTEIPAHFITTPDPGHQEGSFFYTYNGEVTPYTVQGIWKGYRNKELNRKLLLSYGYGDGGGGVNRTMLELRRRLEHMPGLPKVTTGRADQYFAELRETVENTEEYVHTWDGELYLELHRGTYTSQAHNKRMNRKLELLYREAEWMGTAASLACGNWQAYDAPALQEGWKIILRNQFHDIIPGSSIKEVYQDSRLEYEEAERLGRGAWHEASSMAGCSGNELSDGETYTVFNSSSFLRTGIAELPVTKSGCVWTDESGRPLQAQLSGKGWSVLVRELAPMSSRVIRLLPAGEAAGAAKTVGAGIGITGDAGISEVFEGNVSFGASALPGIDRDYGKLKGTDALETCACGTPFSYSEGCLDTPFYMLEWNGAGQLTRLYDKAEKREVLAEGALGNMLQVFEDRPKGRHEAWDIDIFYTEKMTPVTGLEAVRLTGAGPLYASVEFTWRYMDSLIVQTLVAYAHTKRLDFRTEVDWHETRQLLKAAFPVDIRSTEAVYDIQFGNVKRPTHWNTSWDWARFETVGHQWADLSERDYGVSLLNDCKYGYDIKDNVMRLTLIKSAMVPDDTADQGGHVFTYSLLPHAGDWYKGRTVEEAWDLNAPLAAGAGHARLPAGSMFRTDSESVFVDTIKKAEDDDEVILRLHEFAGRRSGVVLSSGWGAGSWQECDLLERPVAEPYEGEQISFRIKPYEIKTFRFRFFTGAVPASPIDNGSRGDL
jgi:alpha-mannosidase